LDPYHAFGAAVAASACPEIVISIAIDAARASFSSFFCFLVVWDSRSPGTRIAASRTPKRVVLTLGWQSTDAIKFRLYKALRCGRESSATSFASQSGFHKKGFIGL
jgi:hypothetical protein